MISSPPQLHTRLFAHFETMRPYTLFWCGLVSLLGACLVYGDIPSWRVSLLVFAVPILGWIAGLYLADFYDRALDSIQKPHRPIPSGRITAQEALFVGAVYAIIGLGLTLLLSFFNVLLVFVAGFLVFLYARYTKSRGLLGNFNRGAMTVVTYLFGVFSIGSLASIPPSVWLLSVVFFFHDTNSNIIGAIRDVHGDKTGGCTTTPVRYGIHTTLLISVLLSVLYFLTAAGVVSFYTLMRYPMYFFVLYSLCILILCSIYLILFKSSETISRTQALHAHELFVAERVIFASAFIVGMASSPALSCVICIISFTITLISQHLLRERYELT
jgi:geranylgeranylglycerol-phosphate geranylgeranyltransferase